VPPSTATRAFSNSASAMSIAVVRGMTCNSKRERRRSTLDGDGGSGDRGEGQAWSEGEPFVVDPATDPSGDERETWCDRGSSSATLPDLG
jgi:hypothetical protein